MVLISRSAKKASISDLGSRKIEKEYDDKKKKSRQRHILWSGTTASRRAVWILLIINGLVALLPLRNSSCFPEFSFSSWIRQEQVRFHVLKRPISVETAFPSTQERIQFYMGPKWWEPTLQGIPPSSAFGPIWEEKTEKHLPLGLLANPMDMNPLKMNSCSSGQDTTSTCSDVLRLGSSFFGAALLVQEYYQRNFLAHMYNVWKYEGILGCVTELTLPSRQSMKPVYLWNYEHQVSIATAKWNTLTPTFGGVRDAVADGDTEFFRNQRPGNVPVHSTILWPIGLQKEELLQVPTHDIPWDFKRGEKLTWRGDASFPLRRGCVEYYSTSTTVDLEHEDQSIHSFGTRAAQALRNKYVLALEGDSVPENLLWLLYSNSLVFMPQPTYVSWAMETMLQPWVHYIPVNRTNMEVQLAWAKSHPEECRKIAERSTQWVHLLLADTAQEEIQRSIIHRYQQFVLRAKPILRWSEVWDVAGHYVTTIYSWFMEDWLRVVYVIMFLVHRCL